MRAPVPARIAAVLTATVLLLVGSLRVLTPPATTSVPAAPRGSLQVDGVATGTYRVGGYTIVLRDTSMLVSHPRSPVEVWASPEGAFLVAAVGVAASEERSGVLRVSDRWDEVFAQQVVRQAEVDLQGRLVLDGTLGAADPVGGRDTVDFRVTFEAVAEIGSLEIQAQVFDDQVNRLTLVSRAERDERMFGLGAQHVGGDLRGRAYPIVPREQGTGRGEQPLSLVVDLTSGGAGSADTTPAPLPVLVTSAPRSLRLLGDDVGVFDLRSPRSLAVTTWSRAAGAAVVVGDTPRDHVGALARIAGTMRRAPRWLSGGAIVAAGGGSDRVTETVERLRDAGVDLAAVWLPDWAGSFGERTAGAPTPDALTADRVRYPDLRALGQQLAAEDVRLLLYASPLLAVGSELFHEAEERGFLVRRADGDPYLQRLRGGRGALVDLLADDARTWFTDRIAVRLLGATGASGFMADHGEDLPTDAVTAQGTGIELRATYAEAWTRTTADALAAAGMVEEGLVWHAAAAAGSPPTMTMHAVADQLPDFSPSDGLPSALDGMLAAGFSGLSLTSFDVGGSAILDLPGPLPTRRRTPELAQRAAELAAFTPVMRTSDGLGGDIGISSTDDELLAHLARMVSLFRALGPERARLGIDAEVRGVPYVRHPLLVVPEEPEVWTQDGIFFLGDDVLVAPALRAGATEVEVTLPPGEWVHAWSGETVTVRTNDVGPIMVEAPIGEPAAWARRGTSVEQDLARWRERG